MSGRLVILRHKSWNVWNADNREKVLRDERVHQESLTEEETSSRKRNQEAMLETLRKGIGKEYDSRSEELKSKHSTNPEYMKEKEDAETKKMKREGVAPWKFSDIVNEKTQNMWYLSTTGHVKNNNAEVQKEAKNGLDPMKSCLSQFSRSSTPDEPNDSLNQSRILTSNDLDSTLLSSKLSRNDEIKKKKSRKRKREVKDKNDLNIDIESLRNKRKMREERERIHTRVYLNNIR